ncbi:MAG: Maf family protein [Hyphomicrobium sp.]|uniref:Maf family protein n=1 Tax=Hyphomicrobium sp. TaxID=82 RepID=UPI00132ACE13|nr:Maf family protein [Hyphomicrobium sp.]KAB2944128.1 MAG: septum formation inhibitor Maf [Hyphomicrobium sp.]MBZ0209427.1 Maf family protein [Hyphomicrobium sp.]
MPTTASAQQIVLASGSRARREMLAAAGVHFTVQAADVDELAIRARLMKDDASIAPKRIAEVLAAAKAEDVSAKRREPLVMGADQVLALGDELLSKAPSVEAARATLRRLRGLTHELHSAVAFAENGSVTWVHVATARLTMRDFSDAFLDDYLTRAGDRVGQSVGAYELEGLGVQLFERIEGDYFTILGLPLLAVLGELRTRGIIAT